MAVPGAKVERQAKDESFPLSEGRAFSSSVLRPSSTYDLHVIIRMSHERSRQAAPRRRA
jgi:hypothetical protein